MYKYTVIYSKTFSQGSMRGHTTGFKYITVNSLSEYNNVIGNEIGWENVWYVFEGHCKPLEDFSKPENLVKELTLVTRENR